MNKRAAAGVLAGALLMSGLLVGVSYGGSEAATEPTVLELKWNTRRVGSQVRHFRLRQYDGTCCGQITLKDMPLFDLAGNEIGRQHVSCSVSDWTDWFCTYVSKIKDGPNTESGWVVAVGVKRPNGDSVVSITGGTGAYENMGGHGFKDGDTGLVLYTLWLTP